MDENLNNLPLDNEEINNEATDTNESEDVMEEQAEYNGESTDAVSGEEEYIPEWARDTDDAVITDSTESDVEAPVFEAEESFEVAPKKNGKVAAIVSVVIVVILAAIIALGYFYISGRNPYNNMGYINVSGRTIKDIAQEVGFATVDEFLAEYSLPADMPEDTYESAAYYMIPLKKMAEMYGFESVDAMKEAFTLGDDVDENTAWGDAEAKIPLRIYVGEQALEQFKSEYGFGDEVTLDTTWGEVRNVVDKKNYEMRLEAEKEAASAGTAEEEADDNAEETGTEEGAQETPAAE